MSGGSPHGDPVAAHSTTIPTGASRAGAEPHHVPHGYVHPKEHHHWWWYAGLAGGAVAIGLVIAAFYAYDSASAPLCARLSETSLTSPDGSTALDVAQVSCFGGGAHQRLLMHGADAGGGHTVVSFDDKAVIRAQWTADNEIEVRQSGGQLGTFEPMWKNVKIHYRAGR